MTTAAPEPSVRTDAQRPVPGLATAGIAAVSERRSILYVGPTGGCGCIDALQTDDRLYIAGPIAPEGVRDLLDAGSFDAAVIDVDVGDSAFDVVLQLNEAHFPCRSVVIGSSIDRALVREIFLVGSMACLRKPVATAVLASALKQACDATLVMRQCLRSASTQPLATLDRRVADTQTLTPREREILQHLLEGATTQTMADRLAVTPRTVKFHVSNLLRKLGVGSRLSLLAKIRRADAW